HGFGCFIKALSDFLLCANRKIIITISRNAMSLSEQQRDLLLGGSENFGAARLDVNRAQRRDTHQSFHGTRVGNDDDIILVLAEHVKTFRREDSHDDEWGIS